tara:strand:+ start:5204 stop:5944 length:741 start_codon:yes stop_codon:yes gene_type:complete
MFLSIITVNKNSGIRFNTTVNNIFNIVKINKEIEWIIIDGNSQDISRNIINNLNASHYKNIKILIENDNGIYSAMNKGINLANSKFIIFINSGDTIIIKNLKKFYLIKPNNNFSYVFGYKIKNEKKLYLIFKNIFIKFESILKLRLPSSHNSIIYATKALKNNTFNCNYLFGADFDQFLNLYKGKHKFIYKRMDKISNINKDGFISTNKENSYQDYINILNHHSYKFGYFYWIVRLKLLRLKKILG